MAFFSSAIYTIPSDSLWIGAWKNPKDFDKILPEDLTERTGCEVLLKKVGANHFKGATGVKTCKSSLRGASYATSEVEITKGKIVSWDRGFDSDGNHVWGAEKAGYVFDEIEN
ncbi:chromophore lyase CpcT/CpeT [Flavobacteriaceae bacterium S356]|uniref:Chromophore lyase CpcT/CpeT n=1 Tax=Asprobacillus argus TaxID=3076534 RepID=A0ABU3LGD2_9FLAO|nr:chromophore lyase CpcT/CpeT [Flavobacteriaceae bacterium S356]